jgi:LL-H family phage holin
MNNMNDFVNIVLVPVLGTVITAIVGYLGLKIKSLLEKWTQDKMMRDAAETCVRAVEQLYKDLHGAEKFQVCVNNLTEMLVEKGIHVTDLEIKMLVESAVQKLNEAVQDALKPPNDGAIAEAETECSECTITYSDESDGVDQ